jgi:hypothetical protein
MKNASPRDSLGLLTMAYKERGVKGFCTTNFGCFLELFVGKNGQHLPLTWQKPAQNNKLSMLENAKNELGTS